MPEGIGGLPTPEENRSDEGKPEENNSIAGLTEDEVKERIENYIFPAKHGMRGQYESTKMELEDLADGEGDPDIRSQYYPGWTEDDFKRILERLGEEEKKLGL